MNTPGGLLPSQPKRRLWSSWGIIFLIMSVTLGAGCTTMSGPSGKNGLNGSSTAPASQSKPAQRNAQLQSREKELEQQVESLSNKLEAETAARESLERRLQVAQAAREEAIREVVRIRDRIQGMASEAEAKAMFAEARVILDRMEKEAFSGEALEQRDLGKSYLFRGKEALDAGNPGGAAYLFDLITALYEGMKSIDPRVLKVKVKIAALRESPSSSSARLENLEQGVSATGLEKNADWIKVKTATGKTGWIMKSQVQ